MEKVKTGRLVKGTFVSLVRDIKVLAMSGVVCVGVIGTLGGLTALHIEYVSGASDWLTAIGVILGMSTLSVFLGSPWFVGGLAAMLKSEKTQNIQRLPLLIGYSTTIGLLNLVGAWTWGLISTYIHARYAVVTSIAMTGEEGMRANSKRGIELVKPHMRGLFFASWLIHSIYIFFAAVLIFLPDILMGESENIENARVAVFMLVASAYPLLIGAFQLSAFEIFTAEASLTEASEEEPA